MEYGSEITGQKFNSDHLQKIILSVLLALSFSAYSSPKNVVLGEFEIGATT